LQKYFNLKSKVNKSRNEFKSEDISRNKIKTNDFKNESNFEHNQNLLQNKYKKLIKTYFEKKAF